MAFSGLLDHREGKGRGVAGLDGCLTETRGRARGVRDRRRDRAVQTLKNWCQCLKTC